MSRVMPKHVSILALPDSTATPISGLYETLAVADLLVEKERAAASPLFRVEVVGRSRGMIRSACGLPVEVHRTLAETPDTDIVLIPSMLVRDKEWVVGSNPDAVAWLCGMHRRGADLCSVCAGAFLLAETGLLDGLETTTHRAFAPTFRRRFPRVRLRAEEVLITAGARGEFVMSGGASSWQDLVMYLIARHASPTAAEAVGEFLLYQSQLDNQAPYISFAPSTDHRDAVVRALQSWLQEHYATPRPVDQMTRRSGLPESSFKRRFKRATGYSPLEYVQHLRVQEAKRRLERSDDPVDAICRAVGYEEPPFFRRLFKRLTRLTPGDYRRKFRLPGRARSRRVGRGGRPAASPGRTYSASSSMRRKRAALL